MHAVYDGFNLLDLKVACHELSAERLSITLFHEAILACLH